MYSVRVGEIGECECLLWLTGVAASEGHSVDGRGGFGLEKEGGTVAVDGVLGVCQDGMNQPLMPLPSGAILPSVKVQVCSARVEGRERRRTLFESFPMHMHRDCYSPLVSVLAEIKLDQEEQSRRPKF